MTEEIPKAISFRYAHIEVLTDEVLDALLSSDIFDFDFTEGDAGELEPPG